jgi:F-type H+-transporting ATPase subunit alpha
VEQKIRRGRVLRELLKQERLQPVPIALQLAWLVAFNSGLLDTLSPTEAAPALRKLQQGLAEQPLTLSDPREEWRRAVTAWLGRKEGG